MAKKSNRSSSKKSKRHADDGEIIDERFAAAATRPQFAKARNRSNNNNNGNATKTSSTTSKDADLDGDGGALIVGSNSTSNNYNDHNDNNAAASSSGLGASLTQAIASDDRFKAALNSDKFGCVPSRDKYGRKTKKKKSKKVEENDEEGSKESSDDDDDEVISDEEGENADKKKSKSKKKDDDDEEEEDIEQDQSMEARIAYLNALSRGDISASSSDDSSSSDDDSDSDDSSVSSTNIHGKSGIFDPNHAPLPGDAPDSEEEEAELTDEPSPYLCILNLNWEHTRAVDVYAMLHSFCPPGSLKGVQVFPSDFGKERMEKERIEGPSGLWKRDKKGKKGGEEEEEEESDDDSEGDNSDEEDDKLEEIQESDGSGDSDDDGDDGDASDSDEEDVLNLAEATAKLYAHFPDQSTVTKNSKLQVEDEEEEGFDIEKLREYEVSKLRYYFAVATFNSSEASNAVYENVDGMEMENSAAEIDVRVLPTEAYSTTIEGRTLRDECNILPAKYIPPENVVTTALRQSRVTCSWERGDDTRERTLTRYGMGKDAWEAMAEGDDIKFYLATSDNSSEEEASDSEDEAEKKDGKKKKSAGMRAMLGLVGSDSEDGDVQMDDQSISEDSSSGSDSDSASEDDNKEKDATIKKKQSTKPSASSSTESESDSDSEEEQEEVDTKKVSFMPGKRALEDKIRSKLHAKQQSNAADGEAMDGGDGEQQTPFQKYLEKRKEKRRERKRATRDAKRNGENGSNDLEAKGMEDDGMYGVDPEFGMAQFSDDDDEEGNPLDASPDGEDDGFFLGESSSKSDKKNAKIKKEEKKHQQQKADDKVASTKEELELLIAGDDDEEHQKDYDMRGLTKLEKHSHKKLRGKRKRQLETLAANVSGQDFTVDTTDHRFAALLDGSDDRFGIDRTNPAYKETGAMKELLEEQSKRRRSQKQNKGSNKKSNAVDASKKSAVGSNSKKNKDKTVNDGDWVEKSSGAMELSSLVMSLQRKVVKGGSIQDGSTKKKKKKKGLQ